MGGRAWRFRLAASAVPILCLRRRFLLFAVLLHRPLPRRRRLPQRRRVNHRPLPFARGFFGLPALASPRLPVFRRRRGLAAARDLRRGELVLRVPRAALLTSDRVMADDPRVAACVSAHRHHLSAVQVHGFFHQRMLWIMLG